MLSAPSREERLLRGSVQSIMGREFKSQILLNAILHNTQLENENKDDKDISGKLCFCLRLEKWKSDDSYYSFRKNTIKVKSAKGIFLIKASVCVLHVLKDNSLIWC